MQRESIPVPVPPPGTPTTGSALLQTAQEMRERDAATVEAISEQLFTGGYAGNEGDDETDSTWTDFGMVCGIAERVLRREAALSKERDELKLAVAGLSADVTRLEAVEAELRSARETNRSLHRRAQEAEAALAAIPSVAVLADTLTQLKELKSERYRLRNNVSFLRKEQLRARAANAALTEALGAAEVRVEELEGRLGAHSAESAEMRGRGEG